MVTLNSPQISANSRCPVEVSLDGRDVCELHAEESVLIRKSIYPIPCVDQPGGGTGWVRDIK